MDKITKRICEEMAAVCMLLKKYAEERKDEGSAFAFAQREKVFDELAKIK